MWKYSDKQILRGGLFGSGQVTRYHMDAWKVIDNVEIVAIANRTVEKAQELAEVYGVDPSKVYSSHKALLKNEDLDFVDIATVPQVHYEQVMDSIDSGRHAFCQKPFSMDLDSAYQMMTMAEKRGVLLSVNENWRWRSWYRKLKELLIENRIGKPRYLYIRRHNNGTLPTLNEQPPALAEKQPYTQDLEQLILFEWGIHIIDVARFLFGDPSTVYASMLNVSPYFKGEDRIVLTLNTGDTHAVLDLSWASLGKEEKVSQLEYIDLEGEEGSIRINPEIDNGIHVFSRNGAYTMPAFSLSESDEYQLSYTRTHQDFIRALRTGKYPETCARDNIKTLAVVFAAYQSAGKNRVVDIRDFAGEVLK